jgi:hypothetical protein
MRMIALSLHRKPTMSQPASPTRNKYIFQGVKPKAVAE